MSDIIDFARDFVVNDERESELPGALLEGVGDATAIRSAFIKQAVGCEISCTVT